MLRSWDSAKRPNNPLVRTRSVALSSSVPLHSVQTLMLFPVRGWIRSSSSSFSSSSFSKSNKSDYDWNCNLSMENRWKLRRDRKRPLGDRVSGGLPVQRSRSSSLTWMLSCSGNIRLAVSNARVSGLTKTSRGGGSRCSRINSFNWFEPALASWLPLRDSGASNSRSSYKTAIRARSIRNLVSSQSGDSPSAIAWFNAFCMAAFSLTLWDASPWRIKNTVYVCSCLSSCWCCFCCSLWKIRRAEPAVALACRSSW